ncbi:hypothetical protein ACFL5K_01140 [Gemmatimonadota bacterium]
MKVKIIFPILIIAFATNSSCSKDQSLETKSIVITEANRDSIYDILADKLMTGREYQALFGYLMRAGFSGEEVPTGKTIGQFIEEQIEWEANEELRKRSADSLAAVERAREELRKRSADSLAAVERAREEAMAEELRRCLDVTVISKKFYDSDWETDRTFDDYITCKFLIKNNSDKAIRAFSGNTIWKTLLGEIITSLRLSYPLENEKPIPPSKSRRLDCSIKYNQFENGHQQLRDMALNNMMVEWVSEKILFTDGSTLPDESK